jgi:hypothetical protein
MQVLATSREPLRVPGETTVAVRPLRLADAVELFGRRAGQAGTQIAPQNPHIEHIYGKIGVSSRVQLASWLRSRPADAPTRTHTSRPPLQDLYSLTNSEILNLTWWIRASWWIRGSIVHQINPIARIHHGNFAAYRFSKHSFTKRPCQHGTACARLGRAGRKAPGKAGRRKRPRKTGRPGPGAGQTRADGGRGRGGRGTRPGRTGKTAGAVALGEAAGVDAGGVPRVRALLSLGRGRARARA